MSDLVEEPLASGAPADVRMEPFEPIDSRRARRASREAAEESLDGGSEDVSPAETTTRAESFGVVFSQESDLS